jgi:PAS domain S-box-containing protein
MHPPRPPRDTDSKETPQEKLLDLHKKIIELEQLEVLREKSIIKPREIKDAYRDHFGQSKDSTCVIQGRKVIFLSPPLARLLGYTQQEMLNTSFSVYVHPDELPRLTGYYLHHIPANDVPHIYNSILRRRDGKDVPVEIRAGIFPYHGRRADLLIVKERP